MASALVVLLGEVDADAAAAVPVATAAARRAAAAAAECTSGCRAAAQHGKTVMWLDRSADAARSRDASIV